jgi:hypothetical protein
MSADGILRVDVKKLVQSKKFKKACEAARYVLACLANEDPSLRYGHDNMGHR